MNKYWMAPVALAVVAPVAPAMADVPYAVTPSGKTEAYFDMSVTDTSDKIANGCADLGWTLMSSTSTVVTCEARMSTGQAVLAALLIGNRYSTPPKEYLRFNIAGAGRSSRVQATGWIETQMAFGQTRTAEMDGANYHNNVMMFFIKLGGRFPPGTTFPNHAYFGSQFANAANKGVMVTSVDPGTPAAQAGLQNGDLITRIAHERIKNGGDLLDGMRKAAKDPTYEVDIVRGGKKMELTLQREFRTPIVAPKLADLPPEPEQPATATQQVMPLSPADELAKFAKLRDDGVITEAEFEAQKKKILGE